MDNTDWLLVSDVDGTLTTEVSIWEFLHKKLGKWHDEGLPNLNAYLSGEIDYSEFAQRDASAYKGLTRSCLHQMAASIPRRYGMEKMLATLKQRGFSLALVSTGLDILVDQISGVDIRISNGLEFQNDICTGVPIVKIPMNGKDLAMNEILSLTGCRPERTIVLGDSFGDVPMMRLAGYSIAVGTSEPGVLKNADANIDGTDLMRVIALVEEYRETIISQKPATCY